jgi:predicted GNAT family acetyltransferase
MTLPVDLVLTHQLSGSRGRFVAKTRDGDVSEMTYLLQGKVMVIDHTLVPPELEGRGIARALLDAALDHARAEGLKIRPVCSYVVAQFRRHPEWGDLAA